MWITSWATVHKSNSKYRSSSHELTSAQRELASLQLEWNHNDWQTQSAENTASCGLRNQEGITPTQCGTRQCCCSGLSNISPQFSYVSGCVSAYVVSVIYFRWAATTQLKRLKWLRLCVLIVVYLLSFRIPLVSNLHLSSPHLHTCIHFWCYM